MSNHRFRFDRNTIHTGSIKNVSNEPDESISYYTQHITSPPTLHLHANRPLPISQRNKNTLAFSQSNTYSNKYQPPHVRTQSSLNHLSIQPASQLYDIELCCSQLIELCNTDTVDIDMYCLQLENIIRLMESYLKSNVCTNKPIHQLFIACIKPCIHSISIVLHKYHQHNLVVLQNTVDQFYTVLSRCIEHKSIILSELGDTNIMYLIDNMLYLLGVDARSRIVCSPLNNLLYDNVWLDCLIALYTVTQHCNALSDTINTQLIEFCMLLCNTGNLFPSTVLTDKSTNSPCSDTSMTTTQYIEYECKRVATLCLSHLSLNSSTQSIDAFNTIYNSIEYYTKLCKLQYRVVPLLCASVRSLSRLLNDILVHTNNNPAVGNKLSALLLTIHKYLSTGTAIQLHHQHFVSDQPISSIHEDTSRTPQKLYETESIEPLVELRCDSIKLLQIYTKYHTVMYIMQYWSIFVPCDITSALSNKPFNGNTLITVLLYDPSIRVKLQALHALTAVLPHNPVYKLTHSTTTISKLSTRYVEQVRALHVALHESLKQSSNNNSLLIALYSCISTLIQYTPYKQLPNTTESMLYTLSVTILDQLSQQYDSTVTHCNLLCWLSILSQHHNDLSDLFGTPHDMIHSIINLSNDHTVDVLNILCLVVSNYNQYVSSDAWQSIYSILNASLISVVPINVLHAVKLLHDMITHHTAIQDDRIEYIIDTLPQLHQRVSRSVAPVHTAHYTNIRLTVLHCIASLYTHRHNIDAVQHDELYIVVKQCCNDSNVNIKINALKCLTYFCTPEHNQQCVEYMIEFIESTQPLPVRIAAVASVSDLLQSHTTLIHQLNQCTRDILYNKLIELLDESNDKIIVNAVRCIGFYCIQTQSSQQLIQSTHRLSCIIADHSNSVKIRWNSCYAIELCMNNLLCNGIELNNVCTILLSIVMNETNYKLRLAALTTINKFNIVVLHSIDTLHVLQHILHNTQQQSVSGKQQLLHTELITLLQQSMTRLDEL